MQIQAIGAFDVLSPREAPDYASIRTLHDRGRAPEDGCRETGETRAVGAVCLQSSPDDTISFMNSSGAELKGALHGFSQDRDQHARCGRSDVLRARFRQGVKRTRDLCVGAGRARG
jgi:hypothetical protein